MALTGDLALTSRGGISAETQGTGFGGAINIWAPNLLLSDQSMISAATSGSGNAGAVNIHANNLRLWNNSVTSTQTQGQGAGGTIGLDVGSLELATGSQITSSSAGAGHAGSIRLSAADSVLVTGSGNGKSSGLFSTASSTGDAGSLFVMTPNLWIRDGGELSTRTSGSGAGGQIDLAVANLNIMTGGQVSSSSQGTGHAGSIHVNAPGSVFISGSGNGKSSGLFSTASSAGNAGSVQLNTSKLAIQDGGELSTWTSGSGTGGRIRVQAGQVELSRGAMISAASTGEGNGGSIDIMARNLFRMDNSLVTTAAEIAQGGNIAIASREVQLLNGSRISAQSSGPGNAGNIFITAGDTFLSRNSAVTTEATMADGGDIRLTAGYMVRLIDSQITTSVGGGPWTTGGNINIDPEFVIFKNSRIIANAFEGQGGNIQITAGAFIADPYSIVDASSTLGIDGTVDIRAPISNLSGIVAPLPKDFLSAASLIREACEARIREGKMSSFIIKGREGIPAEPGSFMPSPCF